MGERLQNPSPALEALDDEISRSFEVERLPFRRFLAAEEIEALRASCSRAFSSPIDARIIELIARYCCHVERRIKGRAAGNIEDLVVRYLLRYYASLRDPSAGEDQGFCHLEIGALFGAATIFSCHATRLAGKRTPTVVIDPFEGYYGQKADPITGVHVDEETFRSNLALFGYGDGEVRVWKGYSTDPAVLDRARGLKVLSLFIDGDHAYDGVKRDWIHYSPLVAEGGYVLFDDYGSPSFPEVTDFVNGEVLSSLGGMWRVALLHGKSLLLQRTDRRPDAAESRADELLRKLKDAERALQRMGGELCKEREERERAERELRAVLGSRSWALTAPLRRLSRALKGDGGKDAG